jgi:hypothetical protein
MISRCNSDHQHMISFTINKLLISEQETESTSISVRYRHEHSIISMSVINWDRQNDQKHPNPAAMLNAYLVARTY